MRPVAHLPVNPAAFPPPPDRRPAAGRRDLSARPAQRPELASRVQPVVRWALYAYICSIPFEMPQRSIPIEIPTLFGCVVLLATLLDRRTAYARVPAALGAFVVYLWLFAAAALANLAS